jgi:hypothetical protein
MIVARSLYLEGTGTTAEWETSQAVAMEGNNAVNYDIQSLAISGSPTLKVYIQVSDDMEVWEDWNYPTTAVEVAQFTAAGKRAAGCGLLASRGTPIQITRRFVRFKYSVTGASTSIIIRATLIPTTVFK